MHVTRVQSNTCAQPCLQFQQSVDVNKSQRNTHTFHLFISLLQMWRPHVTMAAQKMCVTRTPPLVVGEVGHVVSFFELRKALFVERDITTCKTIWTCVSVLLPGFVISSSHERWPNELQCLSITKCKLLKRKHTLNTVCIRNCLQLTSQSPHALPSPGNLACIYITMKIVFLLQNSYNETSFISGCVCWNPPTLCYQICHTHLKSRVLQDYTMPW